MADVACEDGVLGEMEPDGVSGKGGVEVAVFCVVGYDVACAGFGGSSEGDEMGDVGDVGDDFVDDFWREAEEGQAFPHRHRQHAKSHELDKSSNLL